jgi:glycosidase
MSRQTNKALRNTFIYQVFVRNYSEEGTFKGVEKDLDRIKSLGVDFVYLLPIHEVGQVSRKGSLGSPYAIKDYRSINHEYGTIDDFKSLVDAIHERGMKVMLDIVYNHTSPDSVLINEHPEWFYRNKDGQFANRVGDWWDITDLDYSRDKALWTYQIDTLKYWTELGVDGYRWDVASFIPLEFLEEAHQAVLEIDPDNVFLSESVHGHFLQMIRNMGFLCLSESEVYQIFDMAYDYDAHPYFEGYLKGHNSLEEYVRFLNLQEQIYPDNFIKMRNLENHDFGRFAPFVDGDIDKVKQWTALMFFMKGSTMMYAGQEYLDMNKPSLFDRDLVNWDGEDISDFVKKLATISKDKALAFGTYNIWIEGNDVLCIEYKLDGERTIGLFNLTLKEQTISINLPGIDHPELASEDKFEGLDGNFINIINSKDVVFEKNMVKVEKDVVIIKVNE